MDSDTPGQKVLDDEGTVDKKVKERILNARQRVDDREDFLYIEAPVDSEKEINELQQVVYWGVAVKQYLRAIEPLLRSESVHQGHHYYEEVEVGEMTLTPQDVEGYPFSQLVSGAISELEFKIQYGLPRGAELPSPKSVGFDGLRSIIEAGQTVSNTWSVDTHDTMDSAVTTYDERPIAKPIYENAVRHADHFLQQANVGVKTGAEKIDVHPDPI